jgi:RHS repeat-associated protein
VFGQATLTTPTATEDKPTIESDLRFPGQIEDAETGLYYNWHRYYDPEIGRYVTADPIGLVGGVNLYTYVGGDPVNLSDPDGLCPMCVVAAQYLRCVANCMVDKGAGQAWEGKSLECIDWEGNAKDCALGCLNPLNWAGKGKVNARGKKPPHGNTKDKRPATLYKKYDKDGNFQKHGVTKHEDPTKRYTKKELDGGYVEAIERGPRDEMLKKERELVETNPGPENREPWAGRRKGKL